MGRWSGRQAALTAFLAVLAVSAVLTGNSVDDLRAHNGELADRVQDARAAGQTNAAAVDSIETILADVCATTSDRRLDNAGVGRECTLAEAGNIEERLPVVKHPAASPGGVTVPQVEGVVDAYLNRYLADLPADYTAELRTQVVDYLRMHPAKAGEPGGPGTPGRRGQPGRAGRAGVDVTEDQVAQAVAGYLTANPPPAGTPGVGVSAAFTDGCDVVFTYTDGSTSRVGPLCGPPGPQGDTGPQGQPGPQGEQGPVGRGIADMECVDENPDDPASRWRITYTDGDVDEDAGPCRGPRGADGEPGPPGPTPEPPPPSPTDSPLGVP